ncbi:type II CAAX prenyl endopeptidase Rce1 family protein [Aquimarina sp. Aq78]|uniref:CPBP family glutamic-type intramembrane protease n=1 Tax=Aquimarina sp. Aq78 TaxID=1191889 RepID=UPI000D10242B|nr:CPBP family glutamic-type intramembrane protease [Aquimarina sp. Aq78]
MICKACNTILENEVNFCPNCGIATVKAEIVKKSEHLNLVIAFYVVMLAFLIVTVFIYRDGTLVEEIVVESIFALIIVGFTFYDFKNIIELYRFPKINVLLFLGIILAPFITAFLVYYGIEIVNVLLFDESQNYYLEYVGYPNALFWAILFVAVLPPIFEELAFRGFLFNQLNKITSAKATIILTAFIFALIHLSVLSLLWIFPFGLLLGYLRYRYKTLWLGMIIHFIHNLIVLSLDYYYYTTLLEF